MFHSLLKKTKALCALIYDSKIIFISCTYVLFDVILLKILRNTDRVPNIWILIPIFSLIWILWVAISRLRNIVEISNWKKKSKNACKRLLIFFTVLSISACSAVLCMVRLAPLVRLERANAKSARSFTQEHMGFQAIISSELDYKHTYNRVEVKLVEDLVMDGSVLDMEHQKILIKTKKFQKFKIGQVCNIMGTFKIPENFEDFNYQDYLKNNNIYLLMEYPDIECTEERKGWFVQNILIDFKNMLIEKINWKLREPQSSLLMGILFGQDRLFSEEFDRSVRIAGVSHIVAASGYNITILILASSKLLSFLPFKARFPINLILIWGFCILSGLSPSILRACIMTTIALCGTFLGRRNTVHVTLPLATLIFVLVDPKIVLNVGFQLSVMATLGLIYLQPSLASIAKKIFKREVGFVNDTLLTTLSCTVTTLPVTIATFCTLSIWSVLANCLILPVVETTMLFGVLALVSGSIIFYSIIDTQLRYFELVVNYIGSRGWGYWEFESTPIWIPIVILVSTIIFCIYFYPVGDENNNYYLKIST